MFCIHIIAPSPSPFSLIVFAILNIRLHIYVITSFLLYSWKMMNFCSFHVAISFCIFADQTIPTLPFQMSSCRHREKGRKCYYLVLIQKIQPERETCHATEEFLWPWRPQGLFHDQVLWLNLKIPNSASIFQSKNLHFLPFFFYKNWLLLSFLHVFIIAQLSWLFLSPTKE